MWVLGYGLVCTALGLFYLGWIPFASAALFAGGLLAKRMSVSVRSIGILIMVTATAWGFHHGFDPYVWAAIVVGFLMANAKNRSKESTDWGFDFDFSPSGSGSGSSGGYDGGSDGGGGGGGD